MERISPTLKLIEQLANSSSHRLKVFTPKSTKFLSRNFNYIKNLLYTIGSLIWMSDKVLIIIPSSYLKSDIGNRAQDSNFNIRL